MSLSTNNVASRPSRRSAIGLFAAAIAAGAAGVSAAEPRNPLARVPADNGNNNTAGPTGQASSLTIEQVGDALESYGKNSTTNNGNTEYSITVHRGKWNINVIISMSPNKAVIWMTNNLSAMPDANKVSAEALMNVLKKNNEIGPMFFSIAGDSLRLSYPVANANLTAETLRARIDSLVATVVNTESLWNADALAGNAPANQPATPARNPLAR